MASYDDWKQACPEDDGVAPVDCVICTGHPYAPPCGEECGELFESVKRERKRRDTIRRLYAAARTAIGFAKMYRKEDGSVESWRARKCEYQVRLYREDIKDLRRAS